MDHNKVKRRIAAPPGYVTPQNVLQGHFNRFSIIGTTVLIEHGEQSWHMSSSQFQLGSVLAQLQGEWGWCTLCMRKQT